MQRRGNVVRKEGPYSIVEVLNVRLDGTAEVAGYNLIGPGADSSWLESIESAIGKMNTLLAKRNESGGRAP
jgi:hypothetical protein